MNILLTYALAFLVVMTPTLTIEDSYFPEGVFSARTVDDQFWASKYSEQLRILHEPSLYQESKAAAQSYRFLWLRTFHHPVSVRLDIGSDSIATITTKVTSGTGGHSGGHLILNRSSRLTKQETDSYLRQIETLGFWDLAIRQEPSVGPDGAQWIIEGVKEGKYHVAVRWSPKDGAVRMLGLALAVDLARLKIPAKDIY